MCYGSVFLLLLLEFGTARADAAWYLQITRASDQGLLWEIPITLGDSFAIDYIHSSDHTPVHDVFQITKDGGIVLVEEDYQWCGAGLDAHPIDGSIVFDGQWTRVMLHRTFPCFLLRVGEVANHKLTVNGKALPLLSIAKGRERVWIHVTNK